MVTFGIVGLPNVGKSTLFNALVQRALADMSNYPFCTVEPNVSVVAVPDARLMALQPIFDAPQVTPAAIEVVDIAGLVRGAHKGSGLGNQFLGHIRAVDALLHVVRCFPDSDVSHVEGGLDPARDIGILDAELLAADAATVGRRLERTRSAAKAGGADELRHLTWADELAGHLEREQPARTWHGGALDAGRSAWLRDLFLLTAKPVLLVANVGDDWAQAEEHVGVVQRLAHEHDAGAVTIPARFELDLQDLSEQEAQAFRTEYGMTDGALAELLHAAFSLLDLVTFYTGVGRELRAWPVPRGTTVDVAAGRIHTDMLQGFVRAEVIAWDALVDLGSWVAAREHGRVAIEGRSYVVRDGDVIHVRFNR